MIKLYNTLSRTIEEFAPLNPPKAGMYACGPTVYDYTHIGHVRKYINDDILRRILEYCGFDVTHVMNITDVGHLSSDGDEGEDKLEKGAKKFGKTPLDVARFFEKDFWDNLDQVNIKRPTVVCRATEHIEDQIALIEQLQERGYTYQTKSAVYFDVSKFEGYEKLSGQKLSEKEIGVRDDVVVDSEKRNPADFALWFFTTGRFATHALHWSSPWGEGFPGWHIECSAMSMKYLGLSFDIHTGGIDHIPVHHTNEIAQSEGATGVPFVKYWVHHAFLNIGAEKMSKSKGNMYHLADFANKKYLPLAFRYLTFQTHYRTEMNFTWEALDGAQRALDKLYSLASSLPEANGRSAEKFEAKFFEAVELDLDMPKAISIMWGMLRSDEEGAKKATTLSRMDQILGLSIFDQAQELVNIPQSVLDLVEEREMYRRNKMFAKSDELRSKIEKLGYVLKDSREGAKILRKV